MKKQELLALITIDANISTGWSRKLFFLSKSGNTEMKIDKQENWRLLLKQRGI